MSNVDKEIQNNVLKKKELYIIEDLYDTLEDAYIERYRDFMKNPAPQQEQFARDMISLITNDVDTSNITVVPSPCGIGKSTNIQALINYFARHDSYDYRYKQSIGMIVVTDMHERLKKYLLAPEQPQSIWGVDNSNKLQHDKFCTYIYSNDDTDNRKTISELLIEANYKPFVLITTQRFFMMSDEQRETLFTYQLGDGDKKKIFRREIIIFDEKPLFFGTKKISVDNLNNCATALYKGIPKEDVNKDLILDEYKLFHDKIESILRKKEKEYMEKSIDYFYWHDTNIHNITSGSRKLDNKIFDDEQFFKLINEYKTDISSKYQNAMSDLHSFKALISNGGFFITKKREEWQDYDTFFILYEDNRDKFYLNQEKVKVFVLDATASIDCDYELNYINLLDSSKYFKPLKLTINHLDVTTSKSKIVNKKIDSKMIPIINKVMNNQFHKGLFGNMLVVAYDEIIDKFADKNRELAYFGGIKGKNNYSKITRMVQIGLNRFDGFQYFIKYLSQNPHALSELQAMNEEESRNYIDGFLKLNRGVFSNPAMDEIMNKSILADFIQNIFRVAIRNYNNEKEVTVYTLWNCKTYARLNEMIEKYFAPLDVKFNNLGVPSEIVHYKTETRESKNGKNTDPQKIIIWYNTQAVGRKFKLMEMLKEVGITYDRFKNIRKTNKAINALFKKSETENQRVYMIVAS